MPDVGVLNLQIRDDSAKAAEGLGRLASSLVRVKQALGSGLKMGNVATQIKNLTDAMQKAIPAENIERLERLAGAIEKINNAGGINMKGIRDAVKSMDFGNATKDIGDQIRDSVGDAMEYVAQEVQEINNELDSFTQRTETANQIIQNMAWTAGDMADQFERAFSAWNQMRMAGAVGGGAGRTGIGAGYGQVDETGWTTSNPFGKTGEAGWMEWKDGAIEVEYTISDVLDNIETNLESVTQRFLTAGSEIEQTTVNATESVANAIEEVNQDLEEQLRLRKEALAIENQRRLENNYPQYRELYLSGEGSWQQNVQDMYGFTAKAFEEAETYAEALEITMREVNGYVDHFIESMNSPVEPKLGDIIGDTLDEMQKFRLPDAEKAAITDVFRNMDMENVSSVTSSMESVGEAMEQSGSKSTILTENLKDLDSELKEKKTDTAAVSSAFDRFKDSVSNLFSPIGNLIKQLSRIARYRMLRSVIKHITEGFSEGIENYYRYSQAISSSFAPAMDSASSALLQMKNSIGAAVAPLIQELIPVLRTVVSWFVSLLNYANQFIALLRGSSTWSRATETNAKAFDDVKKSATGASAAVKDLLADWDELNIIQSDTGTGGSGGSGTGAMQDYLGMFEEVSKFDNELKSLMDSIEKRFGGIWELAKEVGAALLGWKTSEVFTGVLSKLGGLVATGAIIDLVFKTSQTFTDQYLKTGNVGWLVGDMLETLVGATLARKALSKVLGAQLAEIAIPLTFAVSAGATITALLEDSDVSALDEESIGAAVTAALENGVAAGYLAHILGAELGECLAGGAAATLLTFGVAIGLKAINDTIETGEITDETLKADLISAGAVGAGLAIGEAILGGTAGTIIAAGAGGAIVTYGLLLGVESVVEEVNTGRITIAGILEKLKSAAIVGGGLAFGAAVVGGTLGTILVAGVAGGALTFGLLITLEAIMLNNQPKKVMWGDSDLTSEQIQSWVNEKMFSINVDATIKQINAVIEDNEAARKTIADEMTSVATDLNIIKLGLATKDTYDSLKKSLFGENGTGGVISDLQEYAKKQKVTIKTSMTLLPIVDKDGNQDKAQTAEYLKAGLTGWDEVENYMATIGNDLAEALKGGSTKGLDGYDDELIATLTEKLTRVQQAVTGAQLSSGATGNLLTNLSGLSQKDAASILEEYGKYQEELKEGYNNILKEELASYQSLEAFYLARGEEGDADRAAYYHTLAENLVGMWTSRLEAGVKAAEGPGKEVIANALSELLQVSPEDIRKSGAFNKAGVQNAFFGIGGLETVLRNSDFANTDEVKDALKRGLDEILKASLTDEDYKIVQDALSTGVLDYTNLFSQETIDAILTNWKGDNNPYKIAIQEAWADMLRDALGEDVTDTQIPEILTEPEIKEGAVNDIINTVQEELNNSNVTMTVTPEIAGDETDLSGSAGRFFTIHDMRASAGMSDVNYGGRSQNQTQEPIEINLTADSQQNQADIQSGVTRGTGSLLEALNSILSVAQAINRKEFTVNVTPSTAWGAHSAKSKESYAVVKGYP